MASVGQVGPVTLDNEQYATGLLIPGAATAEALGVVLTASRAYVCRFLCPGTVTISKIAFTLTTAAGSNDNCDAGIFNAGLTTLLASAGSTAGKLNPAAPSVQTLTLTSPVTLVGGTVYYAAFACGTIGTTAAQVASTSSLVGNLMGAAAPNVSQTFQNTAFPLAAPLVVGGLITNVPVLGLLI